MKVSIITSIFFLIVSLTTSTTVYADHFALIICKSNERGLIRVVTADMNITSGVPGAAQKSRSCAQLLHELATKGYEVTRIIPQQTQMKIPVIDVTIKQKEKTETTIKPIKVETKNELIFILESKGNHE